MFQKTKTDSPPRQFEECIRLPHPQFFRDHWLILNIKAPSHLVVDNVIMASENQNTSKSKINTENDADNERALIPGYSTIEEFTKNGFKTLIEATKNSNSLPQDRDWDFYNTHQSFRNLMSNEGDKILHLINNVLKQQGVQGNIKSRDFEEKIELIIEANDIILERVANNLDELAGIRKNPELPVEIQTVSAELPISGSWNKINNAKITVAASALTSQNLPKSSNSVRLLTAKNIQRPQKFFKDKIDNSKAPWEPQIKDKPNNIKPLAIFLEPTDDGLGEIFCHPYELELSNFAPNQWQLSPLPTPISLPKPLSETPLHLVDTTEGLDRLLEALRQHKIFAVDLEHHSYRSFLGFTCLMQISTSEEDFLVDTLALRDKLHVLNEVFTKPTVMKIFHGADHDIEWLQRDLSLYVVNMFDTHQAAKQLGYPQLSLAYLLRRYCRVDADKRFQLADWRIRPLPDELKTYAREDTHYLIYIANMMRNELLQKGENVLRAVYTSSTQICLKRYIKPVVHENSHLELYRRCKKLFDNRQMFALKHLYNWRDSIAREEDESTGFVLPNHMLLQISELLPREMQGILACCNPIPPLVRSNLLELHRIVLKAREQSIIKPILSEEGRGRGTTHQTTAKINVDSVLNCPHEIVKEEFRDDLPTLLGNKQTLCGSRLQRSDLELDCQKAKLNIFETPDNSDDETTTKSKVSSSTSSKIQRLKFLSPYERYRLVKKYAQAEEKEETEKKIQEEGKTKDDSAEQQAKEKTDAERIKALQEHFKSLAESSLQIPPSTSQPSPAEPSTQEEKAPVTLGQPLGKKRKREDQDEPSEEDVNIEDRLQNITPKQQKQKQQNTPKSSGKKKKKNKNKKNMQSLNEILHKKGQNKFKQHQQFHQQQQEYNQQQLNSSHPQHSPQKQHNSPQKQHNPPQKQHNSPQKQHNSPQKQNNFPQKQHNSPQKQQNSPQKQHNNQQFQNSPKQQRQFNQSPNKNFNNTSPRGGKRKWQNNQNDAPNTSNSSNPKRRRDNTENNDGFEPFDYSQVDFRQFQGGAGNVNHGKKVNTNFRGKGSKNKKFDNIGRTNTRSSTFRGRGGGNRGGW